MGILLTIQTPYSGISEEFHQENIVFESLKKTLIFH